jgi:hypothetical protein
MDRLRPAATVALPDASAPARPRDANVHRRTTTRGRCSAAPRLEAFCLPRRWFESPQQAETTHARWRYATNICASRSLPAAPVQPWIDPSKVSRRAHINWRVRQRPAPRVKNPWAAHDMRSRPVANRSSAGCARQGRRGPAGFLRPPSVNASCHRPEPARW